MIDDLFIVELPDDLIQAGIRIYSTIVTTHNSDPSRALGMYEEYLSAFGMLQSINENLELGVSTPTLGGSRQNNLAVIVKFCSEVGNVLESKYAQTVIQQVKERYSSKFDGAFVYEFTDDDLARIQKLINDLRDQITGSELFEQTHKERLLRRLEALQSELHKKMSNFDKLWGLAGEGAVLLGKYGEAAKPFVNVITLILRIALTTQGKAEQLPSSAPNILIKTDDQEIV